MKFCFLISSFLLRLLSNFLWTPSLFPHLWSLCAFGIKLKLFDVCLFKIWFNTFSLPLSLSVCPEKQPSLLLVVYTHVSLQLLTPVLPCILSPVVVSSVSPPFPFCALSLCLQEEGVVSFCKVCVIGLVNTPSRHLPNNMITHAPPFCAYPPPLTLLRFSPHP